MSTTKDGGPAFPTQYEGSTRSDGAGMTLRDYFAAKALPALIDRAKYERFDLTIGTAKTIDELAAVRAYAIADAMLRVRGAK